MTYRIALSYRSAKALVEMQNWRALLEKDQLRIKQRRGRVFQGWNEGKIYFPPTYQLSYVRGESSFSDHRPVYIIFWAEVQSVQSRFRRSMSSRLDYGEALLPYSHGYTELCFF
ncbi:putative inositol-polyphosphate 5-phosphatase [Helianthus annuus]|nr:putative inositol-polyphosphate 5-phosphatase [Helianthus annuus]